MTGAVYFARIRRVDVEDSRRAQGIVRVRGVTEVTIRDRRSTFVRIRRVDVDDVS